MLTKYLGVCAGFMLCLVSLTFPLRAMEGGEEKIAGVVRALSKEQMEAFFGSGYCIVNNLFTPEEVTELSQHIEHLFDKAQSIAEGQISLKRHATPQGPLQARCDYPGKEGAATILATQRKEGQPVAIKLISWVGGVDPQFLAWGRNQKITSLVAQLLGSQNADHLINQVHFKKSGDGIAFDVHQDIQYRRWFDPQWQDVNKRGSFVQVLTAIDRTPPGSGPLVIIPNSHREDLYLECMVPVDQLAYVKKRYDFKTAQLLQLEKGDTVFLHPFLVHYSEENISGEPRRLFINGFACPGANHKLYDGKGSSQEISLNVSAALVEEANKFVLSLEGENIPSSHPLLHYSPTAAASGELLPNAMVKFGETKY